MLARKQSIVGDPILLASDYGPEESSNEGSEVIWTARKGPRSVLRFFSIISMLSVMANTPKTFEDYPSMWYLTYVTDWITLVIFTAEMVTKIHHLGLISDEKSYLKDKWCKFDASMCFFIWISVILQSFDIPSLPKVHYSHLSILRCPRPFIILRYIRGFLKFPMPKARIKQICKRSSNQIYNVTIFFTFFMSFYGLLGVQLFGELNYHCVRKGVKALDVTLNDLTIPDSYCNPKSDSGGHKCPKNFDCIDLSVLGKSKTGFMGFGEFFTSILTVYAAASQEGWVYIMYRAADSAQHWKATLYFCTMIFFIAWMVKNVFIAVITETFNEIRVQLQEIWVDKERDLSMESKTQVLEGDANAWKLVEVNENRNNGWAPVCFQRFLQGPIYHVIVIVVTLANAFVTASISFKHLPHPKPREHFFIIQKKLEIGFTLLYDFEVIFKVFCFGIRGYWSRPIHKCELILAILTTIHIMPGMFLTWISVFQVMRILRLIKASPMLEEFVYKIFGPGKKLGTLIIFTMCLLVITSSVSLQLFCSLKNLDKFQTFTYAFFSMFQILTQEAWPEVMSKTMQEVNPRLTAVVAVYFIFYHLIVTLIVMSLFVAVILDNLELDEDAKKIKQLKVREESSDIKEDLPLRLRVFEKFPERPLMTRLHRIPSDFSTPKVRDSFVTKFVYDTKEQEDVMDEEPSVVINRMVGGTENHLRYRKNAKKSTSLLTSPTRKILKSSSIKKSSVSNIIWSVRRSIRGGSQLFNKRGGTYKLNENAKENGFIPGMNPGSGMASNGMNSSNRPQNMDIKLIHAKKQQAEMRRNQKEEDLRENHPYFDRPLFAVPRESRFRKICQAIVNARYDPKLKDPLSGKERKVRFRTFHKLLGLVTYLDWFMIIVTTLTTISMMFETPQYRVMDNKILQITDYAFVIAMGAEMLLKVLAEGLLFTPKALVKDVSGFLDITIFIVSLIWACWMPKNVEPNSIAHCLMLLRCFRPIRIFILVPHMRRVVSELVKGFKEIVLVAVLLSVMIFIFANYGVHLFGLRFAACNDHSITSRANCTGVFRAEVFVTKMNLKARNGCQKPGMWVPRVWMNPRRFNFDNLGSSMLALFEVLSYKGWVDLRDVIISKMGPTYGIFIHMYVFLGSMIGLTLFVGVVIANYKENKGTALLTVDQMRWSDLKKRLKIAQPLHTPPKPENSKFQAWIYDIVQHVYFKRFIACLVITNGFLLAVKWEEDVPHKTSLNNNGTLDFSSTMETMISNRTETDTIRSSLANASSAMTICFVIEVIMKLIAFTPYGYWQSRRNRFDLMVTILGIAWIVLDYMIENHYTLTLGYLITILRFITIVGKHATLKMLMQTVFNSIIKSFFIIMGMMLLIICYALAGVILFGNLKYGEAVNRQANFRTSFRGLQMLFRIVTGEDWNRVLHDAMLSPPQCTKDSDANFWNTDCGSYYGSIIYFSSFYVFITYIMLNLLVAIIMENFSLFYSNEEDALLSYADIRHFQNTWNIVDVNQRGMIPVRRVKFILRLLKGRLQVDPQQDRLLFKHMCYELDRLHNGEDVTFHDVLSMLSYRSVDIRKALQLEELLAREELEYIIEEEVAKLTIRKWLDGCLKRMREKEQSLIAGLRAMNEPVLNTLRPLEEIDQEEEEEEEQEKDTEEAKLNSTMSMDDPNEIKTVEDGPASTSASGFKRADSLASAKLTALLVMTSKLKETKDKHETQQQLIDAKIQKQQSEDPTYGQSSLTSVKDWWLDQVDGEGGVSSADES